MSDSSKGAGTAVIRGGSNAVANSSVGKTQGSGSSYYERSSKVAPIRDSSDSYAIKRDVLDHPRPSTGKENVEDLRLCKKRNARLFKEVPVCLPMGCVGEADPFDHTYVDFANPQYVRARTSKNDPEKAYICLFICAAPGVGKDD